MICVNREKLYPGAKIERVIIQADTIQEGTEYLPSTGIGVDDLPDDVKLAPGSIIYDVLNGKSFVLCQDWTWQAWGATDNIGAANVSVYTDLIDGSGETLPYAPETGWTLGLFKDGVLIGKEAFKPAIFGASFYDKPTAAYTAAIIDSNGEILTSGTLPDGSTWTAEPCEPTEHTSGTWTEITLTVEVIGTAENGE